MSLNISDPVSTMSLMLRGGRQGGPSSASPIQRLMHDLQEILKVLQDSAQKSISLSPPASEPDQPAGTTGADARSVGPVAGGSPAAAPGLGASGGTAPALAAKDVSASGPTASAGPGQGAADLVRNAGGVLQAKPVDGVSPASKQIVDVGGGTDKVFNYTNATNRTQSVAYSDREGRKGTLTLQPGETGSFRGPSNAVGVRLSPSDKSGNTHPDEVLDEDGATIAPGADANAIQPKTLSTQNQDISKVDGDKDFGGTPVNMTVVLSDGSPAGDGNKIHPYANSTDDAASMGLAGNPSLTANVVISDKTS